MNEKNSDKYKRNKEELAKFLLNQLQYEGKLLASRVNMLLVAESLLFLSYFYLRCSETCNDNIISLIVATIGIIITYEYLRVLVRQNRDIKNLDDRIRHSDEDYKQVAEKRGEKISANKILGVDITIVFLFGWFIFFIMELICKIIPYFCQLCSSLC